MMIEIAVYNSQGQQVDTLQVAEELLGGELRPTLLKQAYVRSHANRRQGTSATKSRGMVSGSTRKLYKQKGTGNARRGAIRTNIMKGGGVAHAKHPRSFRQDMPIQMRRLANRNAILAKAVDGEIKLVDKFAFDKPSTKAFTELLSALKIDRSCLVALSDTRGNEAKSAANIPTVSLMRVDQLNVFDVLNNRYLMVEKAAFQSYLDSAGKLATSHSKAKKEAK